MELLAAAIRAPDDGAEAAPIPIEDATGRVLAEEVRSDRPSPPFDASAMDGYALRLSELEAQAAAGGSVVEFPVAGEVTMGRAPPPLPPGACLRITTGGAVPDGADTVVRREEFRESADRVAIDAEALRRLQRGQHIRRAGENTAAGRVVLRAGRLIDAAAVGAMAAFGLRAVRVRRALRVAVITTGDELAPPGAAIEPWTIRDSNGPALAAMLGARRWIGAVDRAHARDEPGELDRALERATRGDAIVLTGGVSMGHRDLVPDALDRLGARTLFHKLPQRPGRPLLGAVMPDGRPVLALPGNPVSVLATARRFLLPALARRAGIEPIDATASVTLANADDARLDLWWHRPVRLVGAGIAELVDTRGSGDLVAAAASDGLVEIPPGEGGPGPWPFRSWAS